MLGFLSRLGKTLKLVKLNGMQPLLMLLNVVSLLFHVKVKWKKKTINSVLNC